MRHGHRRPLHHVCASEAGKDERSYGAHGGDRRKLASGLGRELGSACSDDDDDTTPAWSSNSPTSDVSSPESTVSSERELAYYFDGDSVLSFDESKVMMNAASSLVQQQQHACRSSSSVCAGSKRLLQTRVLTSFYKPLNIVTGENRR